MYKFGAKIESKQVVPHNLEVLTRVSKEKIKLKINNYEKIICTGVTSPNLKKSVLDQ